MCMKINEQVVGMSNLSEYYTRSKRGHRASLIERAVKLIEVPYAALEDRLK